MPEIIIDGTGSGYTAAVTSDNRLKVDLGGDIVISGISIDSVVIQETNPVDDNKTNPSWSLIYDSNGNLGSVYQFIDAGSYVNCLTWAGYSGTLMGIGSRVTNISEWSVA